MKSVREENRNNEESSIKILKKILIFCFNEREKIVKIFIAINMRLKYQTIPVILEKAQ